MRKILTLPLFVMAIFVSQAMAQTWVACPAPNDGYCKWNGVCNPLNTCTGGAPGSDCANQGTDCEKIYENCLENSSDHTVWSNATCTEVKEVGTVESCGGYCKWDDKCEPINTDPTGLYGAITTTCPDAIENCAKNSPDKKAYSNSTCTTVLLDGGTDYCKDGSGKQYYCQWPSGCYELKMVTTGVDAGKSCEELQNQCKTSGKLYINVNPSALNSTNEYGDGVVCSASGGTEVTNVLSSSSNVSGGGNSSSGGGTQGGGNSSSGTQGSGGGSSSSGSGTQMDYCVYTADKICLKGPYSSCANGGMLSNSCPPGYNNNTTTEPSSASTGGDANNYEYCVFMGNKLCLEGPYSSCADGGILSNNCPYDNVPIVLSRIANNNFLSTMQNAVNLQVIGSAVVQVFDLKGNMVRSLKLGQGSYVVPLSGLPKGLYIVKASNASWKQTVKLTIR